MAYIPKYEKPYPEGWENLPSEKTPIKAEVLNAMETALTSAEAQLARTTAVYGENQVKIGMKDRTVSAPNSGVFGYNNDVSAPNGGVFGSGNTVSGPSGIVTGEGNTHRAILGITVGENNENRGYYTALFGTYLKSMDNNYGSHLVCGKYNNYKEYIKDEHGMGTGYILFAVGNGTGEEARSNALLLDEKGNLKISGELATKNGKIPAIIPGVATFRSMGEMCSRLGSADNTFYSVGTVLRIVPDNSAYLSVSNIPYDYWISAVNAESYSNSSYDVQDEIRKNGGTARYGYYTIAPVKAQGDNIVYINGTERMVEMFNTYTGLIPGQVIITAGGSFFPLYVIQKYSTCKEYTYTTQEDFISRFLYGASDIGYYQLDPLIPVGNPGRFGMLKPDGNTIKWDGGVISANIPDEEAVDIDFSTYFT